MTSYLKYLLVGFILLWTSASNAQDSLQLRNLDYYLEQGLKNSPLLKNNINSVESNKLDSIINNALNKPLVQTIGQYWYAPTGKNWGYDNNTTNGGQYTGLVQVSKNLLNRKNLQIQNQLNSALKDSILISNRINQNDLKKAIVDMYLISFQDYKQMTIFNDLFGILSKQNAILKELLKSAFFTQADYLAFRIDLQQSEITWQSSKVQYLQDLLALNILCNINDTSIVKLADPQIVQQFAFTSDNNPYLFKYKIDSLIVERNRRMVDIYYRPQLNAGANAGFNSIKYAEIPQNFGYSAFLNFSIPIYDGHQRQYQYKKFDINQLTIINYKNQYLNRLTLKLKTINEQIRVNQNLLLLIQRQDSDIENLLKISQQRLYSGDMSAIDYLSIVQRYLNIKVNINQLQIQRQRLISEFNYRSW